MKEIKNSDNKEEHKKSINFFQAIAVYRIQKRIEVSTNTILDEIKKYTWSEAHESI